MPVSGPEILLYEKTGRIVTLVLNRPERMNAISVELAERLEKAWIQFRDDDDAWVCILTGAGTKAFCAGWDLLDQAERNKQGLGLPKNMPQYWPYEIWKPIICALNGFAIAGGFQMAQGCDIRLAANNAEFGIAETRWNMPAWWVTDITRQLTLAHALEIALWGDKRITAQRAYEMGWVNRVVAPQDLMKEAMSWADRMTNLAPRCVRNLKEIIYRGHYLVPHEGRRFGEALEANLVGMEDSMEGPKAFAEKRNPNFKNR